MLLQYPFFQHLFSMNRFLSWLLNIVYVGLLVIFSPMILYRAIAHGKYRQGFRQKFFGLVPELPRLQTPKRRIWFHAVSVGEINLLRPLLQMIRQEQPDWECVISTTSLTGMQLAERLYGEEYTVFYCPLDFSWAVFTAMRRIRPNMLVLAEQEIWPNLFYAAKKRHAKLALINGRFGEGGYRRYKRFRFFFRPILRMLDLIAVQSETYAGWFHCVGAYGQTIEITGSMKFDGAQTDRSNPKTVQLANLAGMDADSDIVFLAGSTQEPEEEYALDVYEKLKDDWPQLKLILVPRHPERFEAVASLLQERGVDWMRRTQLESNPNKKGKRILLVDCVGELGSWWGVSKIAFVGGSMGNRGGQNMLEPAAFGAAVSFGPKTKNFRDIVDLLLQNDAAIVVQDSGEMLKFVQKCLEEPDFARQLGDRGRDLVRRNLGATKKTLHLLKDRLDSIEDRAFAGK